MILYSDFGPGKLPWGSPGHADWGMGPSSLAWHGFYIFEGCGKDSKNRETCDRDLMWPASPRHFLPGSLQKNCVSGLVSSKRVGRLLKHGSYHEHSFVLIEIQVQVWKSRCSPWFWCCRCMLQHRPGTEVPRVWLWGFLRPFQWVCEARIVLSCCATSSFSRRRHLRRWYSGTGGGLSTDQGRAPNCSNCCILQCHALKIEASVT